MKRLFLAIDFSEQVKDELSLLLPADMPGIRAVARNNLHLTLCFLGNADPDLVHQAISAIRLPRFPLSIQGYGAFHWSGAVFWAGLAPSNELLELHGQLSTALVRAGFSLEQRDYQPHITLARRRGKPPYPAIDLFRVFSLLQSSRSGWAGTGTGLPD